MAASNGNADYKEESEGEMDEESSSSSADDKSRLSQLRELVQHIHDKHESRQEVPDRSVLFNRLFELVRKLIDAGCTIGRDLFASLILKFADEAQVELDCRVADFLDAHGQLSDELRRSSSNPGKCARFFLVNLTPRGPGMFQLKPTNCGNHSTVNYTIVCQCGIKDRNSRFYVGLTRRAVHQRVCVEHAGGVASKTPNKPMYQHGAGHNRPFRELFDVSILPTDDNPKHLRKWEFFWQWALHAHTFRDGLSQR